MNRKHLNFIIGFAVICIISSGCSSPKKESDEVLKIIDIEKSFVENDKLVLADFIESFRFLPLETNENCVIATRPNFYSTQDFIIKDGSKQMFLFNKKDGKFIREIGVNDQSPEGYRSSGNGATFDEQNKIIYAGGWKNNYCAYDFQGEKVGDIKFPDEEQIFTFGQVNDSVSAGFLMNFMGDQKFKIVVFNDKGEVLKKYPNYLSYKKVNQNISIITYEGLFYRNNDELNFKELFNDTLLQVRIDTLLPRFVFKGGQHSPEYEKREELLESKQTVDGEYSWPLDEYYVFTNLSESSRFLFFEFKYKKETYLGIYDKKENQAKITKSKLELKVGEDAFLPFNVTRAFINSNNELVTYIDAFELVQWMNENPEKVVELPAEYRNLKNIKEDDNPVLVLVKLKE